MAATILAIADAVTEALNAASLSLAFTATRVYVPTYLQDDLQDLKVQVVPAMLNGKIIDRGGRNLFDYKIYVGVQKIIGSGPMTDDEINAICDPLMQLAEEIGDVFDGLPLAGPPAARCTDAANKPIFSPEHIDEQRLFTSLVTLTFRLAQ